MISRTLVITVAGIISSAGIGAERFWEGMNSHEDQFTKVFTNPLDPNRESFDYDKH